LIPSTAQSSPRPKHLTRVLGFFCLQIDTVAQKHPGLCAGAPYLSKQHIARLCCTVLALYASFITLRPFIAPITWAITLSVIAYPIFTRAEIFIGQRSLRAAIVTALIGVTVIVPAIWVVQSLARAALTGIDALVPNPLQHLSERMLRESPELSRALSSIKELFYTSGVSQRTTQLLGEITQLFVGSAIVSVGHWLIMLFIIFFLLRDSTGFLHGVAQLIPLSDSDTDMLLKRISDTIHATLLGMVAVAILQGILGAVLLWWLGIENIVVWGTIMALLALVPYLGTFVVWIPIAVSLALQGEWLHTCLTIAWGSIVIGFSDNVLYPHLVGQRLHYHSLIVFFFLLGGVVAFGAAGVVIGPVILAITERLLWISGRGDEKSGPATAVPASFTRSN
jgi:predicted PurR-regulated permease PerM